VADNGVADFRASRRLVKAGLLRQKKPRAAGGGFTMTDTGQQTGMITLQRLILPEPAICSETDLYVHRNDMTVLHVGGNEILFLPGGRVWFDTYMNLFSLNSWARGCTLGGLALDLRGEGRFHLRLIHLERPGGHTTLVLDEIVTLAPAGLRVDLTGRVDLGPGATGILILRLSALSEGRLTGGAWLAPAPDSLRDIRLALSVTTFRREAAVGISAARITAFLDGEGAPLLAAAGARLHLFVVDNGQSVAFPSDLAAHPRLTLIPNANLGGAGGFARGLAAATDAGFSHCLFMDDDAAIQMESLLRTAAFLQLARSPRAAVSGAMISDARPWMMWENGAVFDRSCRPRHVGTDLRDGPTVIAMLADAARPRPKGFYAGWWYFAFPIAEVKHYPFPFFVRGDDISFSLAHDFDTVTLNGVISFQEDFSAKESPLTLYLDLRNHLHQHLVHNALEIGPNGTAKIVAHFLLRSVIRMHYDSGEAQLAAWEDIMRGPAFFAANADMIRRRPEIVGLARTEAWRPTTPADLAVTPLPSHEPPLRYGRRMKWLLNGHLIPLFGLFGGRRRIPVSHRGLIWPLWGVKEAVFLNLDESRAYSVRHSKRRGWGLIWRSFRIYLRWRRDYAALRAAHRKGYQDLANRNFWETRFLKVQDHGGG